MQINPLRPSGSAVERSARGETVAGAAAQGARVASASLERTAASPEFVRGGLRSLDSELNRHVAGAQQALNFLDQVGSRLHALKASLSGRLSDTGASPAEGRLDEQLKQFSALWERRRAATSGSLDGRLALNAPGEARQDFRVRGLDRRALAVGDRETLSFAVAGQRNLTVVVDPELSPYAAVRRLDEALMPAGIRVGRDVQGELTFSAREAAWPEIRDTFAVRGGGRRFPAGQFNRVALDAEADAIRPQDWNAEGPEGLRRTLQEIVTAAELVRRARAVVVEALAHARSRFDDEAVAVDSLWASAFVQEFGAIADRPDFSVFSAIAPALIAVSRQRVVSLLSLD